MSNATGEKEINTLKDLIKYRFYGSRMDCAEALGISRAHLNQWFIFNKNPEVLELKKGGYVIINQTTRVLEEDENGLLRAKN